MDRVPELNWPSRLFFDVDASLLIDQTDIGGFAEEADLMAVADTVAVGARQDFVVRYRYQEAA
jgi:hypothetical protein